MLCSRHSVQYIRLHSAPAANISSVNNVSLRVVKGAEVYLMTASKSESSKGPLPFRPF